MHNKFTVFKLNGLFHETNLETCLEKCNNHINKQNNPNQLYPK